jgi:hypothetical protein
MQRFKSRHQAQRFLSLHARMNNLYRYARHLMRASSHRMLRARAFSLWQQVTSAWRRGTADGHWDETTFGIDAAYTVSDKTLCSFAGIGYTVSATCAAGESVGSKRWKRSAGWRRCEKNACL